MGVKLKNGKCILEGVTGRGDIGKTRLNLVGVNGSFVAINWKHVCYLSWRGVEASD